MQHLLLNVSPGVREGVERVAQGAQNPSCYARGLLLLGTLPGVLLLVLLPLPLLLAPVRKPRGSRLLAGSKPASSTGTAKEVQTLDLAGQAATPKTAYDARTKGWKRDR